MAFLTKEQYDYRRKSAEARNLNNEEIAVNNGMTEEQAELISELASIRHEMHCNIDSLVYDGSYDRIGKNLALTNDKIKESGLPPVCGLNDVAEVLADDYAYIDIDDFNLLYELKLFPDDNDERDQKIEEEYERIYDEWSQLNNNIEKYLSEIDKKYGTHWCPTGALRFY